MRTNTLLLLLAVLGFHYCSHASQSPLPKSQQTEAPRTNTQVDLLNAHPLPTEAFLTKKTVANRTPENTVATYPDRQRESLATQKTLRKSELGQRLRKLFSFSLARKGQKKKLRTLDIHAILSLTFGILALLPYIGLLFAIAAIILGIVALRRGQRRGFAIAGIVLGGLVILFYLLITTLALLLFAFWV